MYNQNDDLHYAIDHNSLDGSFSEQEIEEIIAEVPGANDEYDWHWIVKLTTGKFAYLEGGCDYTGWDCQSSLRVIKEGTLKEVMKETPEKKSQGNIKKLLQSQLDGKMPIGTYEVKNV